MEDGYRDDNMKLFLQAVLELRTEKECFEFFQDICTITEMKAIAQRLMVAKMLRDKYVYSDIVKATGASTATVSRVNRSLQYGNGSYDLLFKRIDEKNE